jgi:hypothetical protein
LIPRLKLRDLVSKIYQAGFKCSRSLKMMKNMCT